MTNEETQIPDRARLLELQKLYAYNDAPTFGAYNVDAKINTNYHFSAVRNEDGSIYATLLKRNADVTTMVTALGEVSESILTKKINTDRLTKMKEKVTIDDDPELVVCTFHPWVIGADFWLTDWYDATTNDIAPLVKVVKECGKWSENNLPSSVVTGDSTDGIFFDATVVIE